MHFRCFICLWCLVSQVRGRRALFPCCREWASCGCMSFVWREGHEMVLNMGTPCNISTTALPALVHPPFPSTMPLPISACRIWLFIFKDFLGAHPAHPWCRVTAGQEAKRGFSVSLGWGAGAQGAGQGAAASAGEHPHPPRLVVNGAGWSEVQLPGFSLVFIFQAERKLVIPKPFCV